MSERFVLNRQIYKITKRLEFNDSVIAAGNPPTLHPDDRYELINQLDRLFEKRRQWRADSTVESIGLSVARNKRATKVRRRQIKRPL